MNTSQEQWFLQGSTHQPLSWIKTNTGKSLVTQVLTNFNTDSNSCGDEEEINFNLTLQQNL